MEYRYTTPLYTNTSKRVPIAFTLEVKNFTMLHDNTQLGYRSEYNKPTYEKLVVLSIQLAV